MHVNLRYTATLSRRTLDAQQLDSISTACGKESGSLCTRVYLSTRRPRLWLTE